MNDKILNCAASVFRRRLLVKTFRALENVINTYKLKCMNEYYMHCSTSYCPQIEL